MAFEGSLPPLYESVLDDATLDALFADVGSLEDIVVTVKGGATEHAADAPVDLPSAREALAVGRVRGVQLRYVHEGITWCDTLIRVAGGARLVRFALGDARTSR
jgi:hypothetical protein